MEEDKILFSEAEWPKVMGDLTKAMTTHLSQYRTPVFKHVDDIGLGHGSGSYIRLGNRVFILTNEHVASVRREDQQLTHQLNGQEDIRPIRGNHVAHAWPVDLALLPIDPEAWSSASNASAAISLEQIAHTHSPVAHEILALTGIAGANAGFVFDTLLWRPNCYLARETDPPAHDAFDGQFHFAIDYNPDLATDVIERIGLPLPKGLSGSTVWSTGFVEAKMQGIQWHPDLAKVTGVVWGWPSSAGCLIATRSEHLRSFLAEAAPRLAML